jgi:transcriptional regulator with XRE-family HTH domain
VHVTDSLDNLLRNSRQHKGLTQYDVAKATRTTVSRISRIERGSELLGFPKSARLAKCLNLDHKQVIASILKSLLVRAELDHDVRLVKPSRKRPRAGEEVARLRYDQGVSVRQLAKSAGMLPSRVAKVENDAELVLQPGTAARFADALGVDRTELVELALQDLLSKHRLNQFRVKVV